MEREWSQERLRFVAKPGYQANLLFDTLSPEHAHLDAMLNDRRRWRG
ncbi:hypothetical protein APY03_0889 [Variovorax sp. WDL1]|nr:hypothetical protein APY03_0889 [Variovorax sp. WDL1]